MATRLARDGFTGALEQDRRRDEAQTLMDSYPATLTAAQATAAPLLLQSYVNALLTYVNFIPGIPAESGDTGGKGEGCSRRIVREHESGQHPASQRELRVTIFDWGRRSRARNGALRPPDPPVENGSRSTDGRWRGRSGGRLLGGYGPGAGRDAGADGHPPMGAEHSDIFRLAHSHCLQKRGGRVEHC
jgi:hypothetical protein